jgi:hypothetical protein
MAIGYFLGHYILVLVCCKLKNLASSAEIILVHSMIKFRSLLAYTATAPLNQKLLDAAHLDKISGSRVWKDGDKKFLSLVTKPDASF